MRVQRESTFLAASKRRPHGIGAYNTVMLSESRRGTTPPTTRAQGLGNPWDQTPGKASKRVPISSSGEVPGDGACPARASVHALHRFVGSIEPLDRYAWRGPEKKRGRRVRECRNASRNDHAVISGCLGERSFPGLPLALLRVARPGAICVEAGGDQRGL